MACPITLAAEQDAENQCVIAALRQKIVSIVCCVQPPTDKDATRDPGTIPHATDCSHTSSGELSKNDKWWLNEPINRTRSDDRYREIGLLQLQMVALSPDGRSRAGIRSGGRLLPALSACAA
jgi:hypothetical protein